MKEPIIAIGGGGFSTQSEPELDAYILAQANVARPRIGFIATASGDVRFSERTVERYIQRWSGGEFVTDRVVVPARRLL